MRTVITPDRAKQLLDQNIENNRSFSPGRVRRYASDMAAGRWRYNGESIKIDVRGRMIDGQQRLRAIILSGIPQEMELVENIPDNVVYTLDQGRGRSAADSLKMRGVAAPRVVSGATKIVLNYLDGLSVGYGQTTAAVEQFLSEFSEIETYSTLANELIGIIPPSPVAACLLLGTTTGAYTEYVADFLEGLATGANLEVGDPRLALRQAITNQRGKAGGSRVIDPGYALHVTTRAWNAFTDGRTITTTRYNHGKQKTDLLDVNGGPKAGTGLATLRALRSFSIKKG